MKREAVVIGAGAREHALAQALHESGAEVWAAPGNPGMKAHAVVVNLPAPGDVVNYFGDRRPLVVIGPEALLADGWADILRAHRFPVVGPEAKAARLESSKREAKQVMERYHIPTAQSKTAKSPAEILEWIDDERHWPKVIKQSRLAQGKGVVIAASRVQAKGLVATWATQRDIWDDGVLYEDFLEGYEVSVHVITNGREYAWLPVSQDYKRLTAAPESPNTGGMGAMAPVEALDASLISAINRRVFDPLMAYLSEQQLEYKGIIYAGLMITPEGPFVLEFNVRLGDPETEAMIPILDVDWFSFWQAVAQGELPTVPKPARTAVAVVMASSGYPAKPVTGIALELGPSRPDTLVYQAGTVEEGNRLQSAGGRVLTVVGTGETLKEARNKAYARVRSIDFPGSHYRMDIGF